MFPDNLPLQSLNLWTKSLWCYHLSETSLVELLLGKMYFVSFYQKKFDCFSECFLSPL